LAGDPQRGPSVDGTPENKNSRSDICYLEAGIQVLFHKGAVNAPSSQLTEELSSKKNRTASDDRHNGGHSDDLCFIFLLSFSFFHFSTLLKKSVQYTD
jgi:hypothetical protein